MYTHSSHLKYLNSIQHSSIQGHLLSMEWQVQQVANQYKSPDKLNILIDR
jgi:hypothetical protein